MNIQVTITDATAEADLGAALYIVEGENAKREAAATEDEPAELLPVTPAGALKTSYETVLAATLTRAHESYQDQVAQQQATTANVKELWNDASLAQRTAAVAALQA